MSTRRTWLSINSASLCSRNPSQPVNHLRPPSRFTFSGAKTNAAQRLAFTRHTITHLLKSYMAESHSESNSDSCLVNPNYAEIIVVRHGETEWNLDGRIQGGGESLDQLYERCTSSLERIGRKHKCMASLGLSLL